MKTFLIEHDIDGSKNPIVTGMKRLFNESNSPSLLSRCLRTTPHAMRRYSTMPGKDAEQLLELHMAEITRLLQTITQVQCTLIGATEDSLELNLYAERRCRLDGGFAAVKNLSIEGLSRAAYASSLEMSTFWDREEALRYHSHDVGTGIKVTGLNTAQLSESSWPELTSNEHDLRTLILALALVQDRPGVYIDGSSFSWTEGVDETIPYRKEDKEFQLQKSALQSSFDISIVQFLNTLITACPRLSAVVLTPNEVAKMSQRKVGLGGNVYLSRLATICAIMTPIRAVNNKATATAQMQKSSEVSTLMLEAWNAAVVSPGYTLPAVDEVDASGKGGFASNINDIIAAIDAFDSVGGRLLHNIGVPGHRHPSVAAEWQDKVRGDRSNLESARTKCLTELSIIHSGIDIIRKATESLRIHNMSVRIQDRNSLSQQTYVRESVRIPIGRFKYVLALVNKNINDPKKPYTAGDPYAFAVIPGSVPDRDILDISVKDIICLFPLKEYDVNAGYRIRSLPIAYIDSFPDLSSGDSDTVSPTMPERSIGMIGHILASVRAEDSAVCDRLNRRMRVANELAMATSKSKVVTSDMPTDYEASVLALQVAKINRNRAMPTTSLHKTYVEGRLHSIKRSQPLERLIDFS